MDGLQTPEGYAFGPVTGVPQGRHLQLAGAGSLMEGISAINCLYDLSASLICASCDVKSRRSPLLIPATSTSVSRCVDGSILYYMQTNFRLEVVAIYPAGNTVYSDEGRNKYHYLCGPSGGIHTGRVNHDAYHSDC